eukprot:270511_1
MFVHKSNKRNIIIVISLITWLILFTLIYNTTVQDQLIYNTSQSELPAEEYTYINSNTNENNKTKYVSTYLSYLDNNGPLRATKAETKEFIKQVTNKNLYIEWGSGGSTEIVPFLVNEHVYSLEHSIPWCKRMVTQIFSIHIAVSLNKLSYHCVDTKQNLFAWGRPETNNKNKIKQMGEIYVNYIDSLNTNKFDVFFIDGRFRVACALKIIKDEYYNEDSVIMIHDYNAKRKFEWHYNVVEKYYNKKHCAESLCIFRVKQSDQIDRKQLEQDFNHFLGEWI